MKRSWIKYFSIIVGSILFVACNSHNTKTVAADTDPVFQTDPGLKNITEQISKSPQDATLYFERGTMLRKMQLDSLALKDYKTASSLDTGKADYYSAVGDLLFESKDLKGSVEWIRKALARNPTDKKAHLKIAKMLLYMKSYPESVIEANKVLMQDVHNPEAYFLKGMVYKEAKDTGKAISCFLTSIQEAPDYKESIIQLGLLYSAKKDPVALKYLDNAYRLDTTDVFPIYARGVYYQENKDYAAAKEEYTKCIMKNKRYSDAYFNMGYILMQQDSVPKAWRQYNIVTKVDPSNPAGYFNRGLCSEMMDSIKNAIADYKMAVVLDTTYKSPKEALRRLKAK